MSLDQIKVIKLKIIKNSKGDLLKYLDRKNKYFKKFGETYFNEIKRNKNIIIGKENYSLIIVPPGLWFKFESVAKFSLIVNTLNSIHQSSETLKIPIND